MPVRVRHWGLVLAAAAALAAGALLFHGPRSLHVATTTLAPAQSFLVILGVGDTTGANWDGSVTVTGAAVQMCVGGGSRPPIRSTGTVGN